MCEVCAECVHVCVCVLGVPHGWNCEEANLTLFMLPLFPNISIVLQQIFKVL